MDKPVASSSGTSSKTESGSSAVWTVFYRLAVVALLGYIAFVLRFPSTQKVSVDNFPIAQNVSGTVRVANFPDTQDVSGTVRVANFPRIQEVTVLGPLDVHVANFPRIQEVTVLGSVLPLNVSVTNWPIRP